MTADTVVSFAGDIGDEQQQQQEVGLDNTPKVRLKG